MLMKRDLVITPARKSQDTRIASPLKASKLHVEVVFEQPLTPLLPSNVVAITATSIAQSPQREMLMGLDID